MGVFSSKPKAKAQAQVTEVDKAILSLKTQRKKLTDYEKRTQASVEREAQAVREWVAKGDRQRALLALKKKRIQEDALERAHTWVLKVEQQLVEVESASRQAQVVECLKVGQAAMAALQKELKLDDVEKLMADTQDSKEHLQEVQAMLDSHLSAEEEEAVLKELEELEKELGLEEEGPAAVPQAEAKEVEAAMPSVPTHQPVAVLPTKMPSVPTHQPVIGADKRGEGEEEEEEKEMRSKEKEAPLPA